MQEETEGQEPLGQASASFFFLFLLFLSIASAALLLLLLFPLPQSRMPVRNWREESPLVPPDGPSQ